MKGLGELSMRRYTAWPRNERARGLVGLLVGEFSDVGARHERAAGAGENDSADIGIGADSLDCIGQLDERRVVQRVELVGRSIVIVAIRSSVSMWIDWCDIALNVMTR